MGNRVDFTVPGNATVSTTLHVSDSLFVDNIEIDPTGALQDQTFTFNGTKFVPTYTYNPSSEPMGFQNTTTDSTISFTNSTRTFTISPTGASFIVWCVGTKYIKTTTETVVIPDTTDQYLIYYSNTGVLSVKTTPYQLQYDAPVAVVYWNQSASAAQYLSEERHGIVMDWRTHEYLHLTRGAQIASGFSAANYTTSGGGTYGNSNADAQIDILHGIFYDEDLRIEISHAASPVPNTFQQRLSGGAYLPVFYKINSGFCTKDVATQYPLKQGTARPKYNLLQSGSWSTPDLGQNKYGISWIAATNMLSEPIVVILGQTEYANIGDAQSAVVSSLDMTGFTVAEFVFLYKVIYQVSTAYTNTPHARIGGVYDIRSSGDTAGGTSVSTADHGGLTGLLDDDHPQYALIDGARSFTGTLGLRAGSASASTAPIKFNASSVLMTTPEAHSVEWDGTNIYATTVAGTRKTVAYIDNFGSTNVLSADKWSTGRTVTFATGAVTGSFSIDGSANVSDVVLNVGTTSTPTLSQLVLYGNLTLDGASAASGSPRTIGFNLSGSGFSRLSLESSGGAQLGTGQRLQLYSYHGIEIRGARGISGAPAYQPFVLAGVADTALTVYSASATNLPIAIRGATSQTADLQQWQNSAGTSLASISNNGTFSVPNITITNPGVGVTSKLTFTKTSDTAFIDVTEFSADQTLWSHTMGDNPDGGDYFRWYMFDYQGYGGDWEPLSFGALSATMRANNISMYGDVVINSGGWHSGGSGPGYARQSGKPGAVSTITQAGAITPTFNSVGYTGTNSTVYWVKIDTGATTFSWGNGAQATSATTAASAGLALSTSPTTLSQGVTVTWSATTGASAGDQWQIRVYKSAKLVVKAATGQTTNLQEWQNSSSTKMAFVDASGGFYGIALGSPNQTGSYLTLANTNPITLNTGGASVIGFVVKGAASQIEDLQQWNTSANVIQSNIRSDGTFETVAGLRFYNAGRSAFSTLSNTSGNLSFNYQFALTDRLTVTAGASATVPITVKAFSATQTANLQEWQSSAGTALTYITSTGTVVIGGPPVNQSFGLTLRDKIIGSQQTLINSGLQVHFAMARGNSTGPWMSIGTVDDGGQGVARTVIVNTSNVELFSVSQTGTIIGTTSSSVNPGLILRGASGQTADLQQWQNSSSTVLTKVAADGSLTVGGNLTVNGTTFTVNSTTVTIDDPIFTLGGDTPPGSDDGKDRGIEFRWHNGSAAKLGFFGFDDSTGKFTFIPDAANASEVFSGTTGEIDAKFSWPNVLSPPTITLYGAVSGTIILTNASTASASITMAANSVVLGTDTSGAYVGNVFGQVGGITAASAAGEGGENNQITLSLPQGLNASATPTFSRVISTQANTGFDGTPPFQVTSTGFVSNLNANYLGGKTAASFVLQSEYTDTALRTKIQGIDGVGSGFDAEFLGGNAASTYLASATYTGPDILNKLVNIATQPLTNLNADKLDGEHGTYFAAQASLEAVLGDLLFVGLYNATNYTATNRSASSSVVTITSASAHGLAVGNVVGVRIGKKTATFVARSGTAASLNIEGVHGLITGQKIVVDGITDTSFNGTWTVSGTAASAVYFNTVASTTVASASVSGYVAPASFWGQTFTVTAVPTSTTFQYAFAETVNIVSAASDGKIFRMPTPVWSGAVGASATASSTYRHAMYWIVSDSGLSDFVDADLSGKQTWNEADSNLIKGDWVIAINPANNPASPQTNLTLSQITFQMLPFSEESFVKGKITTHMDDPADPHGAAGYLLRDNSAVLGTPIRLASVSRNGTVATVTTSASHGFIVGKNIVITSVGASYDGNYVVSTASSVTPTIFTYLTSAASAASTNASSGFVAERDSNRVADFVFAKLNHNHNTDIQNAINVHSAATDPHPTYLTQPEATVLYAEKQHAHETLYEVKGAVAAHQTASLGGFDHTTFLTSSTTDALYFPKNGTFDDRYYIKDIVDSKIAGIKNEISPTDGAQSSRIYIGASAPAAGNLLRGDIWIQTESLDLLAPVAPIGLTVSATSPTTTTLGWSAWPSTSLVTSLTLIRSLSSSFTSPTTLTAASSSVTFSDTGLSENVTYYYRLNANNGANPSAGATASVSVATLNAAPPSVTGVTAASVSSTSNILMTWTGASAGDLPTNKYRIYLSTTLVATASASPYTFTGLSEATLYTVGVQTIDNGGLTSATVSASTTTANLVPTTVGTVTGASSGNQITFSWSALNPAIPDFATYRVYLSASASPGNELSAPSETTNQSITFGGLIYATTYTARVYAVDKSGTRSAAPSISTVTIGPVPDATPPVAATITSWQPEASYGAMKLIGNWSSSADFNFGQIEVSTDGANWTSVFSASATISGSINIGCGTFAAGQTVYARINVRDSNGNWGYGAAVTYTLIASPTIVTADSTNSWRNTSGGEYNSQGNSRPYQGYATNSAFNAIGLWYYGTKPSDIYNNGRRKFVDGSLFVILRGDAGSSAAMTPTLAMHDGTASPGTISNVGAPALYFTGQSAGVSVTTPAGGSPTANAPIPTAWVETLVNGSHRGIAVYAPTSPVYANFLSVTENGYSGLLFLAHLG